MMFDRKKTFVLDFGKPGAGCSIISLNPATIFIPPNNLLILIGKIEFQNQITDVSMYLL